MFTNMNSLFLDWQKRVEDALQQAQGLPVNKGHFTRV